jgi:hypothetical protein
VSRNLAPSPPSAWRELALVVREIANQLVELRLCPGRKAAPQALLELVGLESAGDVLLAEPLGDGLAFAIARS